MEKSHCTHDLMDTEANCVWEARMNVTSYKTKAASSVAINSGPLSWWWPSRLLFCGQGMPGLHVHRVCTESSQSSDDSSLTFDEDVLHASFLEHIWVPYEFEDVIMKSSYLQRHSYIWKKPGCCGFENIWTNRLIKTANLRKLALFLFYFEAFFGWFNETEICLSSVRFVSAGHNSSIYRAEAGEVIL